MRNIKKIVLHQSASDNPNHDNLSTIREWHLARGFDMEGYHYFVRKDGTIEFGRPISMKGAHCKGHNHDSIGICLSGLEGFTSKQFNAAARICVNLSHLLIDVRIMLHKDLASTECPNYTLEDVLSRMRRIISICEKS